MAIITRDGLTSAISFKKVINLTKVNNIALVAGNKQALLIYPGSVAATTLTTTINGAVRTGAILPELTTGTNQQYISGNILKSSVPVTIDLYDLLWDNAVNVALTTAQAVVTPTLPPRCDNGLTTGDGLELWGIAKAANTAIAPVVTVTYTDASGATGLTTSITRIASEPAGKVTQFVTNASGVRAITSVTYSVVGTTGTFGLMLVRKLGTVTATVANQSFGDTDFFQNGTKIYPSSLPFQIATVLVAAPVNTIFNNSLTILEG